MPEFLIIRHGQSQADLEARHEGRADFPLTDLGREQAQKAADWIADQYPPHVIYASPLKRAAETAQIIAGRVGLTVQFYEDLMEWNNQLFQCFLKLPMQPNIWLVTGDTGMHLWKTKGTTRWVVFSNRLEHIREVSTP